MIVFTYADDIRFMRRPSVLIKSRQSSFGDFMIRLGIPSKGRMEIETAEFIDRCGLTLRRVRRRYLASLDEFPNLQVVYQRQEDIVKGVETGFLTFGIVGKDLVMELREGNELIIVHEGLGFGKCTLEVAVPEAWEISSIEELKGKGNGNPFRVASKFPRLTSDFLREREISFEFVSSAGTLEVSPALGKADFIVDLVSTGQTLEDNRLKRLEGGRILDSEAVLIANARMLRTDQEAMKVAKQLLELFEGTLRGMDFVSVYANMRGTPERVIPELISKSGLNGLQGPTVSAIFNQDMEPWFAIHVVVPKKILMKAIESLREVGGSGVVVTPTTYIFEEEPPQYRNLLDSIGGIRK
ncbi:MAG: ATP phosphoribosyltransferase [Methanobacteriota archaeon]|nr:MAG: ATP phosphoribosyltransferase [Euryarchaeota archaeon]